MMRHSVDYGVIIGINCVAELHPYRPYEQLKKAELITVLHLPLS